MHDALLVNKRYNIKSMPQKPKYNLPDIKIENNVGKNIAKIRKSHGLSQKELSSQIGITQSLLSHYEIGRLSVPVEVVIQIAKTLKTDSNKLLGLSKEKNSNIISDLKITNRMRQIQKLPANKKRSLFEIIDGFLKANE